MRKLCQNHSSKNNLHRSDSPKLTLKQRNQAISELNFKLKLENSLKRELRPVFTKMNNDFRAVYAGSGRVINFDNYLPDITALLRKHYNRVQKQFLNSVRKFNCMPLETKNSILLDLALIAWIANMLETQPQAIVDTTGKDAQESINMATQSLAEEGEALSLANIAIAAAVINRRKLFGRITGISVTETQAAAESTKLLEAETLSGRTPYTIASDPFAQTRPRDEELRDSTKQWITVNDASVRASHVAADRQTVDIDDNFIVGSAEMRHPGDMSLGAPIREWVNCRCSSNYKIEGF